MPELPNPDLRLAILKVLDAALEEAGGASGKELLDRLELESKNVIEMEPSLMWLRDNGLMQVGLRMFVITKEGRSYLLNNPDAPG
jgi:hypothetical protein